MGPFIQMAKPPRITLYSTSRCPHCKQLKSFLRQHRIPFGEQNIERNKRAYIEFQRQGRQSVPMLIVGQQVIFGFDRGRILKALNQAGIKV